MICARRVRTCALGALVALLSAFGVAGPAFADNTQPKREVLTSGGEGGAYSKLGGEDPTGGSDPTPSNPGPAAERALSGDPVSVPGDAYVIHETAPSAPAARTGSLGAPITAAPNCYPNKIRYGYGNPGPGDNITGAPITNVQMQALFPILEQYAPEVEGALADIATNPRSQAVVMRAETLVLGAIGRVSWQYPQVYPRFVGELWAMIYRVRWASSDLPLFYRWGRNFMERALAALRLKPIDSSPSGPGAPVLHPC